MCAKAHTLHKGNNNMIKEDSIDKTLYQCKNNRLIKHEHTKLMRDFDDYLNKKYGLVKVMVNKYTTSGVLYAFDINLYMVQFERWLDANGYVGIGECRSSEFYRYDHYIKKVNKI